MKLEAEFLGFQLNLEYEIDGDDILFWVFDVKSPHTQLLNEILHENYSDEICELINKDIDEKSKEYAFERQLSNYEDRQRERFVFRKHGENAA
ncbi:MAG: hypothetical protein GY707_17445 [Desulfobacteraceae bacterium]|nr:hypothetical protein [Desulfobacteraceae bacterium]